jgi:hypothetical protein
VPTYDERDALHAFIEAMQSALRCLTPAPFTLERNIMSLGTRQNPTHSLTLNELRPVLLGGRIAMAIMAGNRFQMQTPNPQSEPMATVNRYFYALCASTGEEALTFQWTPNAIHGKTLPHLHVGRAVVSDKTLLLPDRFHKVHVPTGHITLAAVVRLAIEEFQVKPLTRRLGTVLDNSEHAELAGLGLLRNR